MVCEIKLGEYFQKSFPQKTVLCIKKPRYIPRNLMLITLLKCLYTFNNKGGIQKISSYCFGHLTVPPFRIFFDTFFSKVRKRQVCVIVLLLTKHNVILVLEFSAHGYQIIYRISSYSFRGNYSILNLEIVANSNSCGNISIFYL